MADFSHLQQLNISTQSTVDFPMYQLAGEPVLKLLPASESNRDYFNALLRKTSAKGKRLQKKVFTAEMLKDAREEDRIMYAKHILKGWEGITDKEGNDVPFTEGEALGFLSSLPDWIFDEIRAFASDIQNFIENPIDVEEKAKN